MKKTSFLALLFCYLFAACHYNLLPVPPPNGEFELTIWSEQNTLLYTKTGEANFSNQNFPGQTQIVLRNPYFFTEQVRGHSNVFADLAMYTTTPVREQPTFLTGEGTNAVITQNFTQTPGDWQYIANNGSLTITEVAPRQLTGTFEYRFPSNGRYTFNSIWGRNIRITGRFVAVCTSRCN
jgi:hypothetical protein